MKTSIVWFRDNLRLYDNLSLFRALSESERVIPVFVFDQRWFDADAWGNRRMGTFRQKFLVETVAELQNNLEAIGSGLWMNTGDSIDVLLQLSKRFGGACIYAPRACTTYEIREEVALAAAGVKLFLSDESTLIHPDDLPFSISETPEVFSRFRQKAEKFFFVRECIPAPQKIGSPDIPYSAMDFLEKLGNRVVTDTRSPFVFKGGESEGRKRLHYYLFETHALSTYKETRNGLVGNTYSSRFSPWLANGSLSPREIYAAVKAYESEVKKNDSTYWLVFELLWRDFFKFMAMKHGRKLFFGAGINGKRKLVNADWDLYEKWKNGETGQPFIDACMNELRFTGYMSNRGRQNVASYLVHNLGLDWRMGASWFENILIDYDPASNYGNWQYVAGVGNDPRENRVFNPVFQSQKYDPEGVFQKLWI
ncbi:MAG: DASH family cryptochrome [Bacteroidia bacterium]